MQEKGEVIHLNCSNCRAPLCEIWTTEIHLETPIAVSAQCPHCNDTSFEKTILQKFYMGSTEFTNIEHVETKESSDTILKQFVQTSKAKKYG
tara:strand:- start:374 stop:649 length:276 start_codon:yes stop_codon:yes gene_type:complete